MEGLIAVLVIGALLFLWGYGDSVAASQKVVEQIRTMLHKERLAALDKGLPAPDGSFDEALLAYLTEGHQDTLDKHGARQRARAWAITLILAGIGWATATIFVPRESPIGWLQDTVGFGSIPILLGVGILLHMRLSRD